MSVPGLALPYCTTEYADNILGVSNGDWIALSPDQKEEALQWGRVYLDSTYSCLPWEDTEIPEAVQTANAYAAGYYLEGLYFVAEDGSLRGRTRVEVAAGSVMSRTDYDAYLSTYGWDDPSPVISAVLAAALGCSPNRGSISEAKLVRT